MYVRSELFFNAFGISRSRLATLAPAAGNAASSATTTNAGAVRQMPATANLGAAPTAADFNALLQKLRDAGHMAP